jgi:hypothetical protein
MIRRESALNLKIAKDAGLGRARPADKTKM